MQSWLSLLTRWGQVTHICISKLDQRVVKKWLVAYPANQWWLLVNWTLGDKIWSFESKQQFSYKKMKLCRIQNYVVYKTVTSLTWPITMTSSWARWRLKSPASTVYSGPDQRKHQSSASLAFVRGIHRWPVNSPHKWPVTRTMFPFDDVIMESHQSGASQRSPQWLGKPNAKVR